MISFDTTQISWFIQLVIVLPAFLNVAICNAGEDERKARVSDGFCSFSNTPSFSGDESIWSGECRNGKIHGKGVLFNKGENGSTRALLGFWQFGLASGMHLSLRADIDAQNKNVVLVWYAEPGTMGGYVQRLTAENVGAAVKHTLARVQSGQSLAKEEAISESEHCLISQPTPADFFDARSSKNLASFDRLTDTTSSSTAASSSSADWISDETVAEMKDFFLGLLSVGAKIASNRADKAGADARVRAADDAYKRNAAAPKNSLDDYKRGAELMQKKKDAESLQKKVLTEQAREREFEAPNRQISSAARISGEIAPVAKSCLAQFDSNVGRDADGDRRVDRRYTNMCSDVRLLVYFCSYREDDLDGVCNNIPTSTISYKRGHEILVGKGQKLANGKMPAEAYCAAGSTPRNFRAFESTHFTGQAQYDCIWN